MGSGKYAEIPSTLCSNMETCDSGSTLMGMDLLGELADYILRIGFGHGNEAVAVGYFKDKTILFLADVFDIGQVD